MSVIQQIEGVDIVDLLPAGVFLGVGFGTVCLVGEWPKGPQNTPTQVSGDATIRSTFGGFSLSVADPLSFATNRFSNGNAFCWLKGKTFSNLILVRPNLDLALGVKVRITDSVTTSVNGAKTVAVGPPATITDPNASFNQRMVGLTITTTLFTNGGNNVVAAPIIAVSADGHTISFTNPGAVAEVSPVGATWTINGYTLAQAVTVPAGTRVRNPAAPTQEFGLSADVTFAAGTDVTTAAFTAFNAATASYTTRTVSAVPVYSVQGVSEGVVGNVTQVDSGDLFRAGIGIGTALPTTVVSTTTGALDGAGANASALTVLTGAQIDAAYSTAITSTLPGAAPQDSINIIASARQSAAIRTALLANANSSSQIGVGRVALVRPAIGTLPAAAEGAGDPGVGANRGDRAIYCYPHFLQFIDAIPPLDPTQTGQILIGADSAMATILSNLAPEENPGQVTSLLSFILSLEPGLSGTPAPASTNFQMTDYIAFKSAGIAALRRDNRVGAWVFQSGVTSVDPSLFPTQAPIKRRRMADNIQDSCAVIALKFDKKLGTRANKSSLVTELFDFLDSLASPENPARQRIDSFTIDTTSGNGDPNLIAAGIFVVIVNVRLLGSLDDIVLQTTIGESVQIQASG